MSDTAEKKQRLRERIFSEKVVNDGRQKELDMAKALMIFCLAFIHVTIECTPEEKLVSGIPYLFDSVIGGPFSAPMYMFAMGFGMAYVKDQRAEDFVIRGIKLAILGIVLNLCRFFIPFVLGYISTGDYDKFIAALPYRVFGNDILQFESLAMMIMGLS